MKAAEKIERRAYLGASDFAAILGVDRFRKPIDVWEEKTGRREARDDDEEDSPASWGRWLERAIVERWSRTTGLSIVRTGGPRSRPKRVSYTHPDHPFIRATPDAVGPRVRVGRAWCLPYIVEAKTSRAGADFGEEETDEIPRYYKAQTIVQAACSGAPIVHVAVLIAGSSPRRYVVEPTSEQVEAVISAGVEFWNEYVLPDVEPPDLTEEYLRRKFPGDDGDDLVATDADVKLAEMLRLSLQNEAAAALAVQENRTKVIERIGEHSRLLGPGFRISYKRSKDSEATDWKSLSADYRKVAEQALEEIRRLDPHVQNPDGTGFDPDLDALASIHTQTKPGTRRFTPTFFEQEDER